MNLIPKGNENVTPESIRDRAATLFRSTDLSFMDWQPVAQDLLGAATRIETMEVELADATDQIGRAEMAEKAMAARVAELENRYRALIPGDVIQEWDEVFVSGDWVLVGEQHHGMMIHTPNTTTRRRIGKDRPLESRRIADAPADGKPDGQEENSVIE